MKRNLPLLFTLLMVVLLFSCATKQEIVPISDNQAPTDNTVSTITKESYVNRVYISLLGRKPSDTEFQNGLSQLNQDNMSVASREALLEEVMDNYDFFYNQFDLNRINLINSTDTSDIQQSIFVYNLVLNDPQYESVRPIIEERIVQLEALLAIPDDLAAGTLDIPGAHRRFVNNEFYDKINMGTLNFVQSCFENLLFRYPTSAELESSISMVDGFSATVFLEAGRNKNDWMTIFFDSSDYYEGQVRDVYQRFLFRDPDSVEQTELTVEYKNTGDYEALLRTVLSSDEYAGL